MLAADIGRHSMNAKEEDGNALLIKTEKGGMGHRQGMHMHF